MPPDDYAPASASVTTANPLNHQYHYHYENKLRKKGITSKPTERLCVNIRTLMLKIRL